MSYFPKFSPADKELLQIEHQKGLIKNSVDWFSYLMTSELKKHLSRRWKHESIAYLEDRLGEELAELCDAMESNQPKDVVEKECADVANFAMMIADVYRQKANLTKVGKKNTRRSNATK